MDKFTEPTKEYVELKVQKVDKLLEDAKAQQATQKK